MYRSITTNAIVIRRGRLGEFHKSLALLTDDRGLIGATAFGAYRMNSRLRMGSEPFTLSTARLYYNPVQRSYKVTELEVRSSWPGLREELPRMAAASLWAEVAQRSMGAGELSGTLFGLFVEGLDLLEPASERREPYVTIQFLWRFLALAGWQPDPAACDRCGASLAGRPARWVARSSSFQCAACAADDGEPVSAGALRYLDASGRMPFGASTEVSLDADSLAALRRTLPRMVEAVLEGGLWTLRLAGSAGGRR